MKRLVCLILLIPYLTLSQHSISGSFSPADKFTQVFLYKSKPNGASYINRALIEPDGSFSIPLDSSNLAGIYKVIFGIPYEDFNFDVIYDGKEDIKIRYVLDQGLTFEASSENILWATYLNEINQAINALNGFYSKGKTDEDEFSQITSQLKDVQQAFEKQAKGKMVLKFIEANRPYSPSEYEAIGSYFNHVRENYLKPIDFNDEWLQSSDFLTEKIMGFVFDLISNPNNLFYQEQVDRLVKAIGEDNKIHKTALLELLWQRFVGLGNNAMANYITNHYLEALANETKNQELLDLITIHRNVSIGSTAPNFDITISGKKTTLHDLNNSNQYLVVFWSSTCSHCLIELPKVRDFLDKNNDKDITVVAFGMEDEELPWKEVIKDYPNFIHVLGLGKWNNPVSDSYGVEATPCFFLLDKDKKIMAKPEDAEAVKTFISSNR